MKRLLAAFAACASLVLPGAVTPSGFWFEKTDHFLTPSEPLCFTYTFDENDKAALRDGVDFRIYDMSNRRVTDGKSEAFEIRDGLAIYRLLSPEQVKTLKTGWHTLEIRPAKPRNGEFFRQKFHVRNEGFARRVVYLLDCVTPEGFAFWLNGDDNLIEPLRSFPEEGKPDCVVVSSYTALPEETQKALDAYVRGGGTALFFGVNNAQLDGMNPLALNRADPYPKTAKRDRDGKLAYLLNVKLADGAKLLEASGDGTPEIAEKAYGSGRVIAYAGALKPGSDTLIPPYGLGLQAKERDLPVFRAAPADAEGFREGISRNNFGRFGWLNDDRVNAISIRPEHTFRMWDVNQDYFGVSFSGSHTPGKLAALKTNWLGKSMLGTGGRWGRATEIVWGLGTPGVLLRNPDAEKISIESPMLGYLAYPVKGGTRVIELEAGSKADLKGLSSNWFLIWNRTGNYDAWPLLFTFNRRISGAKMEGRNLEITFAKRGIDLAAMPLSGVRHYTAAETAAWRKALPREIAERCARWSRIQAARTVGCVESYKLDKESGTVTIRNDFEYLAVPNDWSVEPEYVAPVPPLVPLYAEVADVKTGGAADLGFATLYGPLWGAPGKRSEYTLPLPDAGYGLPVTAADPRLDLAANKALFDRITEHLKIVGMLYIAPNYSIVERKKGRIYPERELREATSSKSGLEAANWNYIDLHRTLGGVTGNLMFKPYIDGVKGYDDTRARLNAKIDRNIRRDIEFFQYKTFLRYRPEPFTGAWSLMAFIAPVRYNDGFWMFHDMNETAGIFLQTLGLYSRMAGDPVFFESNEPYIDLFMSNYLTGNDWAWMASNAVEWGMGNNIDMLNAELSGWSGMVRIKEALGKPEEADFGRYMTAKAAVATGARLNQAKFYNSLNFPIPPHLAPVIHEMAEAEQSGSKGAYLPLGVSQGYGEGWPSLWPTSISKGLLKHFIDGKDFYSTSKGVPFELLNFYRSNAKLAAPLRKYEGMYRDMAYRTNAPYLYSRIAGNASMQLPYDRADIERMLFRTLSMPECSAKSLGAGLADWEMPAMVNLLGMLVETAGEDQSAACVPAGDERNGAIRWETAGKGAKFAIVRLDAEPENVADGAASVRFEFAAPAGGADAAVFTRFDRQAVQDKKCAALSFLVKSETPGALRIVLPNHDWTRRGSALLPLGDGTKEWKRVRLEFDRDLKMNANAVRPADLRGELFLYNGGKTPVKVYIDDLRFEP
ncbi:MAG: hypothetical protein HPZ91_12535 [Lentisphaeria bacterium]|nr:hypothetical protein [Lentisphaeria bacterium]